MGRPKRGKGKAATKNSQNKTLICGTIIIGKLRRELQSAGLGLRDTRGRAQCATLLRVLQYLGTRGINTPEGVGCGYYRIATRIQELEERGWQIASNRERIVGADGLSHEGIARYVLLGRRSDFIEPQSSFDFGDVHDLPN